MTKAEKQEALDAIAKEIEQCKECKRNKIGKSVPGEGNPDADIVFIGEAPGKTEAETGRPFVGRAGKVLRALINASGLKEENVFITSPVKRLPEYVTPTEEDIDHGRTHLVDQLAVIQPKFIVVLGNVAAKTLLPGIELKISKDHGRVIERDGVKYFISYHPAAALHQPNIRPELVKDFNKVKKLLKDV